MRNVRGSPYRRAYGEPAAAFAFLTGLNEGSCEIFRTALAELQATRALDLARIRSCCTYGGNKEEAGATYRRLALVELYNQPGWDRDSFRPNPRRPGLLGRSGEYTACL